MPPVRPPPLLYLAYLNLGDAYARAGSVDKAKKAFGTYLELGPNGTSAAYARQQVDKG